MSAKVLVISDYRKYHSVRSESNIFIGLAKSGYDITVMTYMQGQIVEEMQEAGIKVIDFHPKKKTNKKEISKIRQFIIENKIEILHLFNSSAIISGIKSALGLPVKVIAYRGYCGNIHWYDPTAYLKFLHPRIDYIHCNSIGVEKYIRKQLLFSKKKKAVTINKGHNVDWYSGNLPLDIRKELGLHPDSFLLVNVCNNRKMKGIPYLIKSFNLLPKKMNIHLLLIGNNINNKSNQALVKSGKNEDKVHFLNYRDSPLEIVAACDVFVLSSLFGESITKSVIEAMCLETTPLITDIPGNIELVENGKNGLVVPVKNPKATSEAITKLYNDRNLTKQLGVNAKKHIREKLNEQRTIEEMAAFYKRILQ